MPEMKSLTLNDKTYDCFVDSVARNLASATAVIKSASGESVTLSDASDVNLYGLRIFGKTTQDGTPTPDAPVAIESIDDEGSVMVNVTGENDAQRIGIAVHKGLHGIPVDSGGNYTDANGQQWICDEVDFARGVYVRRVLKKVLEGSNSEGWSQGVNAADGFERYLLSTKSANLTRRPLCSHFKCVRSSPYNLSEEALGYGSEYYYYDFAVATERCPDVASWKTYLANQYAGGTPITVYHPLDDPIETPLSDEELATYAELHTYRNNTTVSNDVGAHMELEYVMDAKKYIDSLMGTGSAARLDSVTIKASAWVTEADGLHSQVVTIAGVTPYSKVDLLPSVEQLAVFHNKDVAFVTENEDGVVTVFAIGDKPIMDYDMQVSITEVTV